MSSVNKVILIGNVGRDPEVRHSSSGDLIVNLSVATSERWKDKNTGERKEKTEWHRVVIFNDRIAKVAEEYARRGAKVYIEGQLQTRKWTDQAGVEKYSTEVVLTKFRGELVILMIADDPPNREQVNRPAPKPAETRKPSGGGEIDDEIPFGPCK